MLSASVQPSKRIVNPGLTDADGPAAYRMADDDRVHRHPASPLRRNIEAGNAPPGFRRMRRSASVPSNMASSNARRAVPDSIVKKREYGRRHRRSGASPAAANPGPWPGWKRKLRETLRGATNSDVRRPSQVSLPRSPPRKAQNGRRNPACASILAVPDLIRGGNSRPGGGRAACQQYFLFSIIFLDRVPRPGRPISAPSTNPHVRPPRPADAPRKSSKRRIRIWRDRARDLPTFPLPARRRSRPSDLAILCAALCAIGLDGRTPYRFDPPIPQAMLRPILPGGAAPGVDRLAPVWPWK